MESFLVVAVNSKSVPSFSILFQRRQLGWSTLLAWSALLPRKRRETWWPCWKTAVTHFSASIPSLPLRQAKLGWYAE